MLLIAVAYDSVKLNTPYTVVLTVGFEGDELDMNNARECLSFICKAKELDAEDIDELIVIEADNNWLGLTEEVKHHYKKCDYDWETDEENTKRLSGN